MSEEGTSAHRPKNWWRDSSLVQRLKASADLVGMIRSHGVDLKPQGSDLVACCPFHTETTPSFRVSPAKNLWRCFGCGKGGSAVDWIVSVSGCSIREAFEQLRIQQGEVDPTLSKPHEWVETSFAPDPAWDDTRLMDEVVGHYARRLELSPLAQEYLQRRGLWDLELVRRYRLGFADRTLGKSIGQSASQRNTRLRERLASVGLMRESGHEHFSGCVVVPVLGDALSPSKGESADDGIRPILGLYGRRVNPCTRPGQVPHLYLKGAHRGVFNAEAVRSSGADTLILCESLLDALTFVRWGWDATTCAYGVRGVTPDLWAFLTGSGFRRVVIAFDADEAGDSAASELAPRLASEGLEVLRLGLPRGLDVNDLALRTNDPAGALQRALDGSTWMSAELYPDHPPRLERREVVDVVLTESVTELDDSDAVASPASAVPSSDTEPRYYVTEGVAQPSKAPGPSPFAASLSAAAAHAAMPVLSERPRVEGSAVRPGVQLPPSVAASPEALQVVDPSTVGVFSGYSSSRAHAPESPTASDLPDDLDRRNASTMDGPPLDPATVDTATVEATYGDRTWRVKGLHRNRSDDVLRVTLRVMRVGVSSFHLDTLDLYQAKSREGFARTAGAELAVEAEVIRADLARLVVRLEEALHAALRVSSQPPAPVSVELTPTERAEALALLRRPDLMRQLLTDLERSGMVGEEGNKVLCWLALTSRRLETPLGLLIQSSSAAGKSSLLDGVLRTMPPEDVVRYSALSGQALFYLGGVSLKHKVLCVAEEEGARRASYSLKLLQSDGELSMASTGKDPDSGQLVTREYKTEGPVALALTTTSLDVDPELQNRCLVLSVDESREQTQAIHRVQRLGRTRQGQLQRHETAVRLAVWRNAQRLLEPVAVVNPYASELTFASHRTRTRRDMAKYLTLVEAVALAHQHQKERRFDASGCYIEVDLDDIELANLLAVRGLGMGLSELSGPTERLLRTLRSWVRTQAEKQGVEPGMVRFSRRDLSDCTPWSASQLKEHLRALVEHEVLSVVRGKAGLPGSVQYRLEALEDEALVSAAGLLEVSKLRASHPHAPYRGTWAGGLVAEVGRPEGGRGWAGSENRPTSIVTASGPEGRRNGASKASKSVVEARKSRSAGSAGKSHIEDMDDGSVVLPRIVPGAVSAVASAALEDAA